MDGFGLLFVTIILVVIAGLVVIFARAWLQFGRTAAVWIKLHRSWLEENKEWSTDTAPPEIKEEQKALKLPEPIPGRVDLLSGLAGTSLAEGDLGRFLLRRLEVPGQNAVGTVANLLISIALASTILGLIVTLFGFAWGGDEASSGVDAIQYFPLFFIPTFFGVILGALANRTQHENDEELERLWDDLDTFTITHILPKFVSPKSALEETTERLADAATLFESSGEKLAGTIGQLESAANKLAQLDPTAWAVGLKDTSEKFAKAADGYEQHVETFQKSIEGVGTLVEQQDRLITANAQGIEQVSDLLKGAMGYKDELAETLRGFKESVDKVDELKTSIDGFGSNVSSFSYQLENWVERQNESTQSLTDEVAKIAGSVEPMIEEWKRASTFFSDNHESLKDGLEKLVARFDTFHDKLAESQSVHAELLRSLSTDLGDQTLTYWREARSELSEEFDHPPGMLDELSKLREALSDAQALGVGLPELANRLKEIVESLDWSFAEFGRQNQEFQSTLLATTKEQGEHFIEGTELLAQQEKYHTETLKALITQMDGVVEQMKVTTAALRTAGATTSPLSERRFLGMKVGPPPWMARALKKITKEDKP